MARRTAGKLGLQLFGIELRETPYDYEALRTNSASAMGSLADSLAAAFKTAFERFSGSNVFGLMPDPPFFTFARLVHRRKYREMDQGDQVRGYQPGVFPAVVP